MLKTAGFSKARSPRVHTGMFNPLTLSAGAEDRLTKSNRARTIKNPEYQGLGTVYEHTKPFE